MSENLERVVEKLEWVEIDELTPPSWNPKPHGEENLRQIRQAIERFGFVVPLVVDKETKTIIDGSGRYLVLRQLISEGKWKFGRKIPVVLVDVRDEVEMKKIVVTLQKVMDEPDPDRLLSLLSSLPATPEEFKVMGLTPTEISLLSLQGPSPLPMEVSFDVPFFEGISAPPPSEERRRKRLSFSCPDENLVEQVYEKLRSLKLPKEVWGVIVGQLILNTPEQELMDIYIYQYLQSGQTGLGEESDDLDSTENPSGESG